MPDLAQGATWQAFDPGTDEGSREVVLTTRRTPSGRLETEISDIIRVPSENRQGPEVTPEDAYSCCVCADDVDGSVSCCECGCTVCEDCCEPWGDAAGDPGVICLACFEADGGTVDHDA